MHFGDGLPVNRDVSMHAFVIITYFIGRRWATNTRIDYSAQLNVCLLFNGTSSAKIC
jgi:hypothetical protein